MAAVTAGLIAALPAQAASPTDSISGSGSTWAQNAVDQWRRDVATETGMTVNYSGTGSSAGRSDFIRGAADFAVSELPFVRTPEDGSAPENSTRGYTYVPFVAGGTALAFHLTIDGARLTDLRLSGDVVAKIFSGTITRWDDAEIRADNPGIALPSRQITPVVRADASGSTSQFTRWLAAEHPRVWTSGETSLFPVASSAFKAQSGSLGVAGYVNQTYGEGAITYVENTYAQSAGLAVAAVRNHSGQFVAPTAAAVTAALAGADVNADSGSADHQTQILDGVYRSADPRAYPISGYAYLIVPTETGGVFTESKGATLASFARYSLCAGQQEAESLGNAPLPANLVSIGLSQVARIPGAGAVGCSAQSDGVIGLEATVLGGTDGALSLSMPTNAKAVLAPSATVDGLRVSNGVLPAFSVEDGRALSRPGYTVHSTTSDFVSGSDRMPSSSLTIAPRLVFESSDAIGVEVSAPFAASHTSGSFASAPRGAGVGTAVFGGALHLVAPSDAPAGIYRSTITVTLVSR